MPTYDFEAIVETNIMKGLLKKGGQHATAYRAEEDIDPICGVEVYESRADRQVEHMGNRYAFCSPECKTEFEKNPENYTRLLRFARNDW